LQAFARRESVAAASLTAIGAFSRATVGWFDFASKSYKEIPVEEQCEVLSAIGDVAIGDDGTRASMFTSYSGYRTARRAAATCSTAPSIRRSRSWSRRRRRGWGGASVRTSTLR
jgi:hypothetical protein